MRPERWDKITNDKYERELVTGPIILTPCPYDLIKYERERVTELN